MKKEGGVNLAELSKETRIKREYARMKKLFATMPENELNFCDPLLQNAAFMFATLQDLQQAINANGVTDVYQNGANQSGTKQSDAVKTHIAMTKNHAAIIRQLCELVPPEEKAKSRLAALRDE